MFVEIMMVVNSVAVTVVAVSIAYCAFLYHNSVKKMKNKPDFNASEEVDIDVSAEVEEAREEVANEIENFKNDIDRYTDSVDQNVKQLIDINSFFDNVKVGDVFNLKLPNGDTVGCKLGMRKQEVYDHMRANNVPEETIDMVWKSYCNVVAEARKHGKFDKKV